MNDYEQYEKSCEIIREKNEKLLSDFEKWLSDKNLSERTIDKHISNVDFYINDFLLYDDAIEATDGTTGIGMFLGYWFIKKATWSSQSAIKQNAASLKKFYQFMYEQGKISKDLLSGMKDRIKECMPDWLATMDRYEDPDIEDMKDVWGL